MSFFESPPSFKEELKTNNEVNLKTQLTTLCDLLDVGRNKLGQLGGVTTNSWSVRHS